MYDDVSPGEVRRGFFRWLPTALILVAALAVIGGGLTYAGHKFGWWLAGQDATRQAQVTQNGYSNQTTLRQQIDSKLADVTTITTQIAAAKDPGETAALKAQRAAIANIACADAAQITGVPLPAGQAQWVTVNCSDGSVSPGSSLYVTGAP